MWSRRSSAWRTWWTSGSQDVHGGWEDAGPVDEDVKIVTVYRCGRFFFEKDRQNYGCFKKYLNNNCCHQKEGHIVPVIVTLGIQSPPEH